jgi:enoyl-CoA hydratase
MSHVGVSEEQGGILVATIDRAPANAMDVTLLRDLNGAIAEIARQPPRALVLAGRPGFFSGGADLKLVPGYGPAEQREMVAQINEMALSVYELPFPVVGAITGHAIAGGLVLALCTDIRIVSTEGRYGLTEVKVGVPYPQAAIGVVAAELSAPAARLLAFGNELIDTPEAIRLGVFDEAVEAERVLPRAIERAVTLAAFPAEVYARTKADLRGPVAQRLRQAAEQDPLLARWVD